MINRRDLLAGIGCGSALIAAETLRPRKRLVLMPAGAKLAQLIPTSFVGWKLGGSGEIVLPRTEGSLAARLYSEELARIYVSANPLGDQDQAVQDREMMLLIAYGSIQSDTLQLHRPEECYPAVGFEIVDRREIDLPIGISRLVPAVAMTAQSGDRIEDIVYWSRLGNDLPRSLDEQRWDRLRAAFAGFEGDGALVRASAVRADPAKPQFAELAAFLAGMVNALPPRARVALLGQNFGKA